MSITYLSEDFLADAEFRDRFVIESGQLAQVRDSAVARVHQYVECGAGAAVIAEHVAGTPLRALLLEEGAIPLAAAVVVLKDTLRGLAAGQAVGVVHGDLKPVNVILTRAGRARLVDCGLFTREGRWLLARSTPFYLAPEQWSGDAATQSADLYAATVVFFECLVGAPPFHAESPGALFALHNHSAVPLDAVPGPVRQLVQDGLAKDPESRPSTQRFLNQVEETAAHGLGTDWEQRGRRELSRLLAGSSPRPVVTGAQDNPGRERHVRLAAVVGGALVVAVGLSSPPLPNVLRPSGPSGVTGGDGRPPAQAGPNLPSGAAELWAAAENSVADQARREPDRAGPRVAGDTQLDAMAAPVPPADTAPSRNNRPSGKASVSSAPSRQVPSPVIPTTITPTPRTTPSTRPDEPATPSREEPAPGDEPTPPSREEPAPPSRDEPAPGDEPTPPSQDQPPSQEPSEPGAEKPTAQLTHAPISED